MKENLYIYIYPTPQYEPNMTQGQFLRRILQV